MFVRSSRKNILLFCCCLYTFCKRKPQYQDMICTAMLHRTPWPLTLELQEYSELSFISYKQIQSHGCLATQKWLSAQRCHPATFLSMCHRNIIYSCRCTAWRALLINKGSLHHRMGTTLEPWLPANVRHLSVSSPLQTQMAATTMKCPCISQLYMYQLLRKKPQVKPHTMFRHFASLIS